MLQWMGGSRRKVSTSRKSTQKRQKQYFEQRKRQQQQQHEAASRENHIDGLVTCNHQKENRSLDILSLLNVSRITEERRAQFANTTCPVTETISTMTNKGTYARSSDAVDATYEDAFMSIPTILNREATPADCIKATGTRTPSGHQMGTMSLESTWRNTSKVRNTDLECWKDASSIKLSILDLIGDDGASGSSEGHPAHESHAAFSIEGLGKLGTETPVQSPQRPGRIPSDDQSSFAKAAKKDHSCKNFNTMLNDLEMEVEVECLMQDTENPSLDNHLDSFSISSDTPFPFSHKDHKLSAVKDGLQLDGKQWEMNPFSDEDRHDNFWNAKSTSNDKVVYEKCGPNWKNDNVAKNSYFWNNDCQDFSFKGCHLPLRSQEKLIDGDDILDRGGHHFLSSDEPEHSPFMCNYHPQADCSSSSCMMLEDPRDSLTWLSGESCSSSEVRGMDVADMPSARSRRRYPKDLQRPLMSNVKENDDGMWNRTASTITRGEQRDRSRKYRRSNSPNLRSAYFPQANSNKKKVHDEDWLLDEGFPLPETNSPADSFFRSSERSQHFRGDLFSTDSAADLLCNSSCSFGRSEKKASPDEFSSDNVAFCSKQPLNSSFFSKISYGENWLSQVADCFEEAESATANPDLSAQGSVTEDRGDKIKIQPPDPEKTDHISTDNNNKNGLVQETIAYSSEDVGETSLFGKMLHGSDVELIVNKELRGSVPVLCQQKLKVSMGDVLCSTGKDVGGDNYKGPDAKTVSIESSYQLMMFQRCVQLLCVLKS